ncbi:secreted protein/lipoprotein [Streptomyces sp. NPDC102441]|uniref:secreted protein/lipoprotein n=1 Tax=Streptomyces sp. NPDC102441 TaxID=3366176 RepID=UPI00381E8CD3
MATARQTCSRAGVTLRCGAATFVLVLTGCGGVGSTGSDGKPPVGTSTAAEADVLAVYRLMWAEQLKAYRAASADGTDLKRYTARDAWSAFERDLARMAEEHTVMRGDLGHEPEVTTLTAGAQPPTATVQDCVDGSKWETLDTTTGWRLPRRAGQPVRYGVTARLERGEGSRWTVTEYTADRTRSC